MIKSTDQIKIFFLWVDSDGPPYQCKYLPGLHMICNHPPCSLGLARAGRIHPVVCVRSGQLTQVKYSRSFNK